MNFIMKGMKYAFCFVLCFFAIRPSVKITKEQSKHKQLCLHLTLHLPLAPFSSLFPSYLDNM